MFLLLPGAIFLMGLPGGGKDTQAFRFIKQFPNWVHVDTGGEIYRRITDPAFAEDTYVKQQIALYNAGALNDPLWVTKLIAERIQFYASQEKGIIFSGSPRTLYEAQNLSLVLEKAFGHRQILILEVAVLEETARKRSLDRITCGDKLCRYTTTKDMLGLPCPNCKRTFLKEDQKDDEWKVKELPKRFEEFYARTVPALKFMEERFTNSWVDGNLSMDAVEAQIYVVAARLLCHT